MTNLKFKLKYNKLCSVSCDFLEEYIISIEDKCDLKASLIVLHKGITFFITNDIMSVEKIYDLYIKHIDENISFLFNLSDSISIDISRDLLLEVIAFSQDTIDLLVEEEEFEGADSIYKLMRCIISENLRYQKL